MKEVQLEKPYSNGPYNKFNDTEQWIRITEGCPWNHPYCAEPTEIKIFGMPEIVRNKVKIMDMNLLCKPEALNIIRDLGSKRINNKVVYYELICGIDFRFLTQEISEALFKSRFKNIRLAWDFGLEDQYAIKDSIRMLTKAGYKPSSIMIFMICNWKTSFEACLSKMDICKVWNVKIADCWFDNQLSPNIKPLHWTSDQIKDFRRRVRKHNQLINFKIDSEYKAKGGVS